MRFNSPLLNKIGGLAIAAVTRRWMSLLDYQLATYERSVDPVHPEFPAPAIMLFWHEYIPVPLYLRGHCNFAILLSQHQDAEWLSQAARHMGFAAVRGSTNRGGVTALREMLRKCRYMNLAMTPDGPRGPRRQLAPGPVYLSSRLGIPLIAAGMGYDRPWRNPWSWDRFAIPRPFSRARIVVGPAIQIPANLDRDALEEARLGVERLLNHLTTAAERWAESGARFDAQSTVVREALPWWQQRSAA